MKRMIYLAGAIADRSDAECNNWRTIAKTLWGPDQCLDPMRRDGRGKEHLPGIEREIVEADKDDILNASALLVYYAMPSVGTSMEILYAWMNAKPVVVVNASMKPDHMLSYWIRYHATHIVGDIKSAVQLLHKII